MQYTDAMEDEARGVPEWLTIYLPQSSQLAKGLTDYQTSPIVVAEAALFK
jgi:hypothetical protein